MQCACAVLYCRVWPARPLQYFSTFSHSGTTFEKKNVIEHKMCVFIFWTNLAWNNSHSKQKSAIFDKKYTLFCMGGTRYFCAILVELEFSGQIFEKYSNIKFHENSSSGSRVVPCRRMYRQTEGLTDLRKLIIAFRDFAKAPKTLSLWWLGFRLEEWGISVQWLSNSRHKQETVPLNQNA
jgi:hypothetical protein